MAAIIDRVIAWDDSHADDYAPPSAKRDDIKAVLKKMRADIRRNPASERTERAAEPEPREK
jgi:hypothetical protein